MAAYAPAWTFIALMLPFLAAFAAPVLVRNFGPRSAWLLALAPLLSFLQFARFLPDIAAGEPVTGGYVWVPSLDLSFSWLLDGLSLTFALLITGIGTLIVIYSGGYLKGHAQQGRFLAFMLLFMGAMLGLVVSDSLLMLFVYWELTSIASFLLIGFDHGRQAARRAALQALVVTGGGGLCLLAGLVLLWNVTGMTQLSLLLHAGEGLIGGGLAASPYYYAILLLILLGCFTKSAQFPFHFWLPNAMQAPTPVSAYLHSATMVKAGVYLLMRLAPVLGGTPAWEILLPFFGGVTLVTGALLGLRQTDLKMMLAYTTMASLGLLVMLIGFDAPHAAEAAVLYLIAHAAFKGALFMVVGTLDHEAGTRDIRQLGGLCRAMPVTFAAAILAALSMAGLPLFLGFLAKEVVYAALAAGNSRAVFFTLLALVGNAGMFALAFAVAIKPFVGPLRTGGDMAEADVHEGPVSLWLGPLLLGLCGLGAGLFSAPFHAYLSSPMASAVTGALVDIHISTVPHLGAPLYLSLATVALGLLVFWRLDAVRALMQRLFDALGPGPDRFFDHAIEAIIRFSVVLTRLLQPGRLEIYVSVTFILIAATLLVVPALFGELPAGLNLPERLPVEEAVFLALALIGLVAVLRAGDRLTAIVALGIQGFAVAVIFLLFGAPDLSFTQFMVETLSVVVLTLVMTRLKLSASDHRPLGQRLFDGVVALAGGLGFALLLIKVLELRFDPVMTDFFNAYSKVIAHGANVVNVIIVDFRGTDTLGEIVVVAITGLSVLALIRVRAARAPAVPVQAAQIAQAAAADGISQEGRPS